MGSKILTTHSNSTKNSISVKTLYRVRNTGVLIVQTHNGPLEVSSVVHIFKPPEGSGVQRVKYTVGEKSI